MSDNPPLEKKTAFSVVVEVCQLFYRNGSSGDNDPIAEFRLLVGFITFDNSAFPHFGLDKQPSVLADPREGQCHNVRRGDTATIAAIFGAVQMSPNPGRFVRL
ncbi:hypothetical protein BV898_01697 [Hypsibius exemplaris]|uniref:Uncharacterized protein n=1 Tax=Hypsibius exemplaris TaxID=2072580 RepID=A0A1W0XB54_HYPEX|nr:hypothetical protein BV898_01697 [Hypsibius exemplaris]